jgi:hypothetical protein
MFDKLHAGYWQGNKAQFHSGRLKANPQGATSKQSLAAIQKICVMSKRFFILSKMQVRALKPDLRVFCGVGRRARMWAFLSSLTGLHFDLLT